MEATTYYAKRFFWLAVIVVSAWIVWSRQDAIGSAIERQIEPARAGKKTFMQRESEAMKRERTGRNR